VAALRDCELIIHAGDVGSPDILDSLRQIAPVVAVRGNIDRGAWAKQLQETKVVQIDDICIYVLHILDELDLDPPTAGFHAIISGHTHQPKIETKDGVLYFNPGSAGPRRFILPISVGRLVISNDKVTGEIVYLEAK
jgi:putative phosphoesterase